MFRRLKVVSVIAAALLATSPSWGQGVYDKLTAGDRVLYFGEAGFTTSAGSLSLNLEAETKTSFLTREVKWTRTALSSKAAELTGTFGAIKMPAGTRFYGMPFKDGFPSQQKKMEENGISLPSVAWCTPDYKPKKQDPYCFFIDFTGNLNYGSSGTGSRFYPEYLGISSYNNVFSAPELIEQPVGFDEKLKLEVQVSKISKKSIKYKIHLFDGDERSEIFRDKVKRSEDGSASISVWGGTLKIVPDGKKSFRVTQETPFDTEKADENLHPPYALRT